MTTTKVLTVLIWATTSMVVQFITNKVFYKVHKINLYTDKQILIYLKSKSETQFDKIFKETYDYKHIYDHHIKLSNFTTKFLLKSGLILQITNSFTSVILREVSFGYGQTGIGWHVLLPCSNDSRLIFSTSYQIGSTPYFSGSNFTQFVIPSFSNNPFQTVRATMFQQNIIYNIYNYMHRQIVQDQYVYAYSKALAETNKSFINKTVKFSKESIECQNLLRGLETYTNYNTTFLENELIQSPYNFRVIKDYYYNSAKGRISEGWLADVFNQLKR